MVNLTRVPVSTQAPRFYTKSARDGVDRVLEKHEEGGGPVNGPEEEFGLAARSRVKLQALPS